MIEALTAAEATEVFLCQVGTKKILRIYKPFAMRGCVLLRRLSGMASKRKSSRSGTA